AERRDGQGAHGYGREHGGGTPDNAGARRQVACRGAVRAHRRRPRRRRKPQSIPRRRKSRAQGSCAPRIGGRRKLMAGFSIRNPFFIIVCCLMVAILGAVNLVRMPGDLFPPINIPVVVVATFYSGMPPQQIETNITNPFERFFTLASGVDHIESRSMPGVSLIKVYFQPGTNSDADLSSISNLAMADLRRL